jgi:sugar-specific transcriptional regulator TrmB
MSTDETLHEAIEVLQQLGLREYEAKCFVGLSRLSTGTAKQLSEIVEVPRTRVYDAIRALEGQGLVEIQHSSPQRFRAVPLEEAVETFRDQYEARVERLEDALSETGQHDPGEETREHEVWALSGGNAIANRTHQLVESATDEVVLVVGRESLLTADLASSFEDVAGDVDLLVGAASESLRERAAEAVPAARTFVPELDGIRDSEEGTGIGRLLLVDRSTILVSTVAPGTGEEHAVFGSGFGNGFVVLARRLLARGLAPAGGLEE